AATQEGHHRGHGGPERPPRHASRRVRSSTLTTEKAASNRHLVLGYPYRQRQQLHDLVPPHPAPTAGCDARERLPTVPADLRHDPHGLIHLLDRQQPAERAPVSRLPPALAAG